MANFSRRQILKCLGTAIGIAATGAPISISRSRARAQALPAAGEALVSLSPEEAAILKAMMSRIIPADENGPGAVEARADRYVDRSLAGALRADRPAYASGLAAVNAFAQSSKGRPFAMLSPEEQDAVLTDIQYNRAPGFTANSSTFFNLVRTHTIQGMFSDPFYGGNANFIGWELIGYPGARIVVTSNQQRMDVKPEASGKGAYDYGMFSKGEI
jgi:gluconate 2-dehydrogenase gamma chain